MNAVDAAWQELERTLGAARVQPESALVRPESVDEAVAAMAWAARHRLPVCTGRMAPAGAVRLDLDAVGRIRFHEPGDLTLGVDAGITVEALQRHLNAAGQFLPLDVADPATTTLGSVLACHRSGPLRHGYGTVRDFTIGIEAITADGALIHGGGRVVKNVAGYDIMKLLIGSRGTLAIITGAHFRVFPLPQGLDTAELGPLTMEQAEAVRRRMLASFLHPLSFELQHRAGAAGLRVLVRFAGRENVRERYRRELRQWAAEEDCRFELHAAEDDRRLWAELQPFCSATPGVSVLRLSAPPADALAALTALAGLAEREGRQVEWLGRLGLGVFSLRMAPALDTAAWPRWQQTAAAMDDVWLQAEPGAGPDHAWAAGAPGLAMMRTLRRHLDPETRLNPQWSLADV